MLLGVARWFAINLMFEAMILSTQSRSRIFNEYITHSALPRSLQRFKFVKVFFQILTITFCSSVCNGMLSRSQPHNGMGLSRCHQDLNLLEEMA